MSPMFDAFLKFSDGQSLAGVVSTAAYGTYELDFETAYPDKGMGSPLVVRILITETFVTGTSVLFELCSDATSQATAGGGTPIASSEAIVLATLVAGYSFEIKVPDMHLQYLNMKYTTVGTPTYGKVTAYLDPTTGLRHR